jgi:integrase
MNRFRDVNIGDDEAARSWKAEPPSPHDLRRTFNSRMAALAVPKEIRDRLLNHALDKRDTEGRHYNAHDYFAEKRRALLQWDLALSAILSNRPATVVPIGTARKRPQS